ncbi:hypothetical protein BC939DRAFT_447307 [Gamsiella multidivaricata]|uniref:uncharacterized protein n=1 Tax=Gamsiella multidivaricata TaxID=101098 RepID=UPI00221E610C|nr:uncharacterized protein BC939DRAFT_447307 [Gamsiella multidivaricata]KAG0364305.1 hypothetical protein BGZ54_007656 [Gamsiella multidivaricata]KAI7826218.1 hypothetical protein BC939DRAFT_447307 [Gamsiella multidivaricata]
MIVRFGIKSYEVESRLPIYTPTPDPPVLLHRPANRNAVPSAPAIKISSPLSRLSSEAAGSADDTAHNGAGVSGGKSPKSVGIARFTEDHGIEDTDKDNGPQDIHSFKTPRFVDNRHQQQYPSSSVASPTMPATFGPPSPATLSIPRGPELKRGASGQHVVTFQTRPRGLTGDSTNSEAYPTFAAYRQAQHANFDAFAQRIRRALETANVQQQREQQARIEREEGQQKEQELTKIEGQEGHQDGSNRGEAHEPVMSLDSTAVSGAITSAISPNTLSVVRGGRPRSGSAASMISNLSEKIRLGSNFFGRTGRSRAGSDASVLASPTSAIASSGVRMSQSSGGSSSASPTVAPALEGSPLSSITTMVAIASAAAVASAMSIPRSSAYSLDMEPDVDGAGTTEDAGRRKEASQRQRRHSGLAHPLAETMHVDEKSDDSEQPMNGVNDREESAVALDAPSGRGLLNQQNHRHGQKSLSNDTHVQILGSNNVDIQHERRKDTQ